MPKKCHILFEWPLTKFSFQFLPTNLWLLHQMFLSRMRPIRPALHSGDSRPRPPSTTTTASAVPRRACPKSAWASAASRTFWKEQLECIRQTVMISSRRLSIVWQVIRSIVFLDIHILYILNIKKPAKSRMLEFLFTNL